MDMESISEALDACGLTFMGAFHPEPDDGVPGGGKDGTLVLAGNTGPAMWSEFAPTLPAWQALGESDPLDAWTRQVLVALSAEMDARAFFPFDGPPYLPFQRWAMRAGPTAPSPLGILIHPDYGLWHGLRGALLIDRHLPLPEADSSDIPCASCTDRRCLSTCHVNAFKEGKYDVPICIGLLNREEGGPCMAAGCLARHACPVGRNYAYGSEQAAWHMARFRESCTPPEGAK
ncbi:MAG: ferredoxin [Rhodospirillales bacterium]|nr:ferredoxin [Rhodospirillales bacterium]